MVLINPGTGPVPDANPEQATKNMVHLLDDAGLAHATFEPVLGDYDGKGRFRYIVRLGDRECEVDMPGVSVDLLRAARGFPPRLYVAGSSWLWGFAASMLRGELLDES